MFNAMSDRDLLDIGVTRFDLQQTEWGGATRDAHARQRSYEWND
jgi:hypothetical protein